MLVHLPADYAVRKQALAWLALQRIDHMVLFKAVTINDQASAERFKAWMAEQSR